MKSLNYLLNQYITTPERPLYIRAWRSSPPSSLFIRIILMVSPIFIHKQLIYHIFLRVLTGDDVICSDKHFFHCVRFFVCGHKRH